MFQASGNDQRCRLFPNRKDVNVVEGGDYPGEGLRLEGGNDSANSPGLFGGQGSRRSMQHIIERLRSRWANGGRLGKFLRTRAAKVRFCGWRLPRTFPGRRFPHL